MLRALNNLHRFFSTHPLTSNAAHRAWFRFAAWQIESRLREEVIFSWIAGQKLAVRNGMSGATGNIYVGLHEFADMMFPLHLLREGDLFLDVGANVGSYTILASGIRRSKTWAFEPDQTTAWHLTRNVSINGLNDLVTLHECAVGPVRGEVHFTVGRDTVNKVAVADDTNIRIVRQERLDDLVGANAPIMMKIDVEGYEAQALRGAESVLAAPSLKAVELETVDAEVEQIMHAHRFERAYYDPFTRHLSSKPIDLTASNSLFVRDRAAVEDRLRSATKVTVLGRDI